MRLKKWTHQHTIGFMIGILTILAMSPIVIFILEKVERNRLIWRQVMVSHPEQGRVIALAAVANLFWFHYFLKKQRWNYGYGIIYAMLLDLIIMLLLKYVL